MQINAWSRDSQHKSSEFRKIKYQVGCGASVYATGSGATSEDCKNVETLFSKVGKCWR